MKKILQFILLLVVVVSASSSIADVVSRRLKDVITSKGQGTINVFHLLGNGPDLTADAIESFRVDNNGALSFAVDVNEAASGTEKASSQGIALDTVVLKVVKAGTTTLFTNFSTNSQSLLARENSISRTKFYTLIGDTGSSRITGDSRSEIDKSDFDAVITIPVSMNLAGATTIELQVMLLKVNENLGDPEAFYDFSGGYEDLALLSRNDSIYLENLKPGQKEAPLVIDAGSSDLTITGAQYFPTAQTYYMAAYEDNYPEEGDYDFNDCVVAYRVAVQLNRDHRVVGLFSEGYLVSRGASYPSEWFFKTKLAGATGTFAVKVYAPGQADPDPSLSYSGNVQDELNARIFPDMKALWALSGSEFVNTEQSRPAIKGYRFTLSVTLNSSIDAENLTAAPFDPYLLMSVTGFDIHYAGLPSNTGDLSGPAGYPSFSSPTGKPFALPLPDAWIPPAEKIDLALAYPQLMDHIRSNKTQALKWYANPKAGLLAPVAAEIWKW